MIRKPGWWARKCVTLAAHALPPGPTRERYMREFVAELYAMTRWKTARYVFGVATNARRLRKVVVSDDQAQDATARTAVPLTCTLNLHHRWHLRNTEDGGRYGECARCHKERPEWINYLWRYPGDNVRGSWGGGR